MDPKQPKIKIEKKMVSSSSSNNSSSSSEDSSSSEEEIPEMPKPMKSTEWVEPKKEPTVEDKDEVVFLGKPNDIVNLPSDDDDKKTCLVCNNQGHSSIKCQMKCRKCNQLSYKTQIICTNCGQTYPKTQTLPTPTAPNPFIMFMPYMQFCMQQYSHFYTAMFQPVAGPSQAQSSAQGVKVTRKDMKRNRKKTKSESKHSPKKRKADKTSESDSDSSSKANKSIKKRKKQKRVQPTEASQPTQQQALPPFTGFSPRNIPLPAEFIAPGYNPMLAFTQIMGYNPTTMNFP